MPSQKGIFKPIDKEASPWPPKVHMEGVKCHED